MKEEHERQIKEKEAAVDARVTAAVAAAGKASLAQVHTHACARRNACEAPLCELSRSRPRLRQASITSREHADEIDRLLKREIALQLRCSEAERRADEAEKLVVDRDERYGCRLEIHLRVARPPSPWPAHHCSVACLLLDSQRSWRS